MITPSPRIGFCLWVTAAFLALAAPAGASSTIGTTAPSSTSGACGFCVAVQTQVASGNDYQVLADGVITNFEMRTGSVLSATDQLRLLVWRGSGSTWTLGAASPMSGLPPWAFANSVTDFGVRVPVLAGDRLGIEIHNSGGGNTAYAYATGSASDNYFNVGASSIDVGTTYSSGSTSTNAKLNLQATVEADTDHDGFGDESQDLCPGKSGTSAGCPGILIGSTLLNPYNAGWTGNVAVVQVNLPGATVTAPYNGVVTHWGVKGSSGPTTDRLSVVRASGSDFEVVSQTDTATTTSSSESIIGGATRLSIRAGDRIALSTTSSTPITYFPSGSILANSYAIPSLGGMLGSSTGATNSEPLFAAVMEPDADGDGFGDITQDACSSDASEQGACPKPVISHLKFSPTRFAVGKRPRAGSSIKFSLSKASRVKFTVKLKRAGRKIHGRCVAPTRKNKSMKRCTYYTTSWSFSKTFAAGARKLSFSGKFKRGKKTRSLRPGSYLVTASPTSSASAVVGKTVKTTMKIVN